MKIVKTFNHDKVKGFKFGHSLYGKPRAFSCVYYIDGLLIDTGPSRMRDQVLNEVQHLDIQQIFVTHHHEDHTGNLHVLQKQFDCPSYASEECCTLMKNPPKLSLPQIFSWGKRPANTQLKPAKPQIKTNNFTFDVIPIPGHASDMVALHEPNKKWLFCADLYVHYRIAYFLENESMWDQINSIKKILELEFDVLLCGHNPQFKDAKLKLRKKLVFFESFFEQVKIEHHKGNMPDQILKNMNLKENWSLKIISGGHLSQVNMIKSAIRDLEDFKGVKV